MLRYSPVLPNDVFRRADGLLAPGPWGA
jgi:hypothetical protein